ncbi:MAG: hypothetical protein R3Y04_04590 [Rikenellaceae bacterium]
MTNFRSRAVLLFLTIMCANGVFASNHDCLMVDGKESIECVDSGAGGVKADSVVVVGYANSDALDSYIDDSDLRRNRGLAQLASEFLPEGAWITGTTFSYSTHDNDAYKFLVLEDITSYGYTLNASPLVAYAVSTNMAIGARFVYGRTLTKVENADLVFGDADDGGINVNFNNIYILSHSYSAMAIWRQYIPLGNNKRFALFNELQLEVGGSQSKFSFDTPTSGVYSTSINASLGISPGIVAFATNDVAFEVSVGMMGLSYSKTKQVQNQVYEGEMSSGFFNFKVNLLAIGLGVSFYL